VDSKTVIDARKNSMGSEDALALAKDVDEVFASKGSKHVHFDLRKEKPSKDELLAVMLGPTGNLRAPCIKQGRRLFVGFDKSTYEKVLVKSK
jgi:arsenate reductase-like glutaredoxin family protein